MGPTEKATRYTLNTYRRDLCLVKGKGCWVWDDTGKKYLDLIGGIATCPSGHANPVLAEAMKRQALTLVNASNLYLSLPQLDLAEKLSKLSGMKGAKCFFSNSGTEAVETSLKLARKHTGRKKFVATTGAFHGRSLGCLSATWEPKYRKPFKPLVGGFSHVPYGDEEAMADSVDDSVAAVLVEPIQGESGVVVPPAGYLKSVQKLCKASGALLVFDEVQTGVGRTGKFFCFQHDDVKPDIVTLAKGLGNGVPIGATIAVGGIEFEPGDHGSTFGGNALCCAVALENLKNIAKHMPSVPGKGAAFMKALEALPKVKSVRGKGLMVGAVINADAKQAVKEAVGLGLLMNAPRPDILRFLPPLTITKGELALGAELVGKALEAVK